VQVPVKVGVMIEVPRAALQVRQIHARLTHGS